MTMNYHADNLEPEQIKLVGTLIGSNRVCLCRAISQVSISRTSFLGNNFPEKKEPCLLTSTFKSNRETSFKWHVLLRVGVVTFTRTRKRRNYYIQAIDMDKERVVIEYQIKSHVVFERRRRYIVLFETELGMVCLNFVDNDEADVFFCILSSFMHKQTRAVQERKVYVVQGEDDSKTGLKESKNKDNDTSKNDNGSNRGLLPVSATVNGYHELVEDFIFPTQTRSDKSNKEIPKKITDKIKAWFGIHDSFHKEVETEITMSKDEFKVKIGRETFERLLVFMKVAHLHECDFDDNFKRRQIIQYYEENRIAIEKVDPNRSLEYGFLDCCHQSEMEDDYIFGEYYSEDVMNNVRTKSKFEPSNLQRERLNDLPEECEGSLALPAPALPPRSRYLTTNHPSFPLPSRRGRTTVSSPQLERQISRPVRAAPPPPSISRPVRSVPHPPSFEAITSSSQHVVYANSRENLLKSIVLRKTGHLIPVNNNIPKVPPNSPNPKKGARTSLRGILDDALKQINGVNVEYGEEPTISCYWDEDE